MSKIRKNMGLFVLCLVFLSAVCVFGKGQYVYAQAEDDVILEGIYMGDIDLSGMTAEQAKAAVAAYIEELKLRTVTFGAVDGHYAMVTAGDLGLNWINPEDIDTAASLGKKGNIVKRYKAIQDLKHGNKNFDLMLNFDMEAIRTILAEQCTEYDVPAQNATLTRENGVFNVIEGQTGKGVNI